MPTYFPSNANSDISGKNVMTTLQNVGTSIVISLAATTGTTTLDFVTPIAYPNRSGFTVSNGLVVLAHSVTNMTINLTAQLIRVNSAGTVVTSGTASASQNPSATNTYSGLVDASWTGSICSDRVMLRLVYTNTAMSVQSCTLTTDSSTSYCYSSVTYDGTAACRDTFRNRGLVMTKK